MQAPKIKHYEFPKTVAFVGDVKRPYNKMGQVRTKVNFNSLDWVHEEGQLCRNYYNKAAIDLYKRAKDQGADAVIDVRSVVMLESGEVENYQTPECSDDGQEGQILLEGIAVKWVKGSAKLSPSQLPVAAAPPTVVRKAPSSVPVVAPAAAARATSPVATQITTVHSAASVGAPAAPSASTELPVQEAEPAAPLAPVQMQLQDPPPTESTQ